MFIRVTTTAALLAATTTLAGAADLPSPHTPLIPIFQPSTAPFNWSGLYLGAQIGYEFGNDQRNGVATATGAPLFSNTSSPKSVSFGGDMGINYVVPSFAIFGGHAFMGVEGDVAGTTSGKAYALTPLVTGNYREQIQGSGRGRLGVAYDRILAYATAGAAFGSLRNIYTSRGLTDYFAKGGVGYTVGGGVEYALATRWSVRLEYRYTDFGTSTQRLAATTAGATTVRHKDDDSRVMAGVTYHFSGFNALRPVVARY